MALIFRGNYGEVDTPAAALGHAGDMAARRYDRRATGQAARAQQSKVGWVERSDTHR